MHLTQRCRAQSVRTFDIDAATRLKASSKHHLTIRLNKKKCRRLASLAVRGDPKMDFLLNCTDLSGAGVVEEDIVGLDVEVRDLGILWRHKNKMLIGPLAQTRPSCSCDAKARVVVVIGTAGPDQKRGVGGGGG